MNKDITIDCFAGGGGASVGYQMAGERQPGIVIDNTEEQMRFAYESEEDNG